MEFQTGLHPYGNSHQFCSYKIAGKIKDHQKQMIFKILTRTHNS
jgi:hypothetical protein